MILNCFLYLVVILNERFFRQVGWFTPQNPHTMASSMDIQPGLSGTYSPDDTLKQRLFTIFADQSVKSMLRSTSFGCCHGNFYGILLCDSIPSRSLSQLTDHSHSFYLHSTLGILIPTNALLILLEFLVG